MGRQEEKMSDQKRLILAAMLMGVVLLLSWMLTNRGTSNETVNTVDTEQPVQAPSEPDTTSVVPDTTQVAEPDTSLFEFPVQTITVIIMDSTGAEIVGASISTAGGEITRWELMEYEDMPGARQTGHVNLAMNPWLGDRIDGTPVSFWYDGPDTVVVSSRTEVVLTAGTGEMTKSFLFDTGFYGFQLERIGLGETTELEGGILPVSEQEVDTRRYYQAVWYAEKLKKKYSNKIDAEEPVGNVRWIGSTSKYFSILLLPMSYDRAVGYIAPNGDESPYIALDDSRITVYAGPLSYGNLSDLGRGTNQLVDFGWPIIRWIGSLIFWFSNSVLSFVGNWGVRIILVSVALKLVLLPLTTKSFASMQKMQQVQPRMKELQEKHKGDAKKQQEALQKLYKEEGVNPLGGCLPLLLQMPVFFALYRVLASAVELRGAPFVLWINDLSRPEILIPFSTKILGLSGLGLLAILMGAAFFVQQKMTTVSTQQKGMMYFMPILMTWLFMRFPAGLTLYWFVNNLLTIGQQEYIKIKLRRG
jgi:YidC/Oxa1 family membrane protein insertase